MFSNLILLTLKSTKKGKTKNKSITEKEKMGMINVNLPEVLGFSSTTELVSYSIIILKDFTNLSQKIFLADFNLLYERI
jgi:hypothetical protein